MIHTFDYLIVGAGYAGSVLAERLARGLGKKVLVVDRRSHIAGNAYDHYDDAGILVHKYGPHIFHTSCKEVFDYLSRFTPWRQYQHKVLASVDGQLLPIPINLDTINRLYGLALTSFQMEEFLASRAEKPDHIKTSEDVVVAKVGRELYEKFFRGYTRKQWGLDPSELDAQVTARVPTRTNRDDRYFTDAYQAMPKHGFTRMFQNILDHPNIHVLLNTDYRDVRDAVPYQHMIYTGPIDEYFDYRHGQLPYRCLEFKHETHHTPQHQPVAVINYPNDYPYTRVTEFKHLTGQEHTKTSIVYEYPMAQGDPYYPIPKPQNAELYKKYQALAEQTQGVHFVGRLATYRYYNMDQVVAQALTTFTHIAGLNNRTDALNLTHQPKTTTTTVLPADTTTTTTKPNRRHRPHTPQPAHNGHSHRNANGNGNGNSNANDRHHHPANTNTNNGSTNTNGNGNGRHATNSHGNGNSNDNGNANANGQTTTNTEPTHTATRKAS